LVSLRFSAATAAGCCAPCCVKGLNRQFEETYSTIKHKTQNGDTQRNPPPPGFLLSLLSSPSQFLSFSFFLSPFLFVSFSFLYGSVVGGTDGSGVGVPKNLAVGFAEMVGVMDGGTDG
jgi:hypothetical protein